MNTEYVLVLRTCNAGLTSHGGFKWPESGPVAAPDWSPVPECGSGLHGFLWGEGDGTLAKWGTDAKWLVVRVLAAEVVNLDGKVKFPKGDVVCCGDRLTATGYLATNGAQGRAIVGGTATAGYRGTATAGYRGTATAGNLGTATAGDPGTATAGDPRTPTAGNRRPAKGGKPGPPPAGEPRTPGPPRVGAARYRLAVAHVGENGIKPNTPYRLTDKGEFREVTP